VDLDFSTEQRDFREEVRSWLAEHKPTTPRPSSAAGIRAYDTGWQRTQYEGGWAGISWPQEYGGRGLSLLEQLIWYEEYGRARLPSIDGTFVGLNHAGPTLIQCATPEQKAAHLPPILRGDALWCQGFSEPGAGSDLASLRTRAVIDGDDLVVTGQKIWTSSAFVADWQELLVRTDPAASKHRGITWVICDMHSPGIDVRPIQSMDGESEFCEVFYDEVRIPLSNVVGQLDDGWRVAMSTLSFERGTAFTAGQVRLASTVEHLIELARQRPGPLRRGTALADESLAVRLATARAEVAALRAMTYAAISRGVRYETPGPEGSIVKLYFSEIEKRVARLSMDLLGPDSLSFVSKWLPGGWSGDYLRSYASSIGGGTSEIQRNIIGERVLGLPR
jgi:alkylation response protein AidB-like acyl-CoA dehydrogenase